MTGRMKLVGIAGALGVFAILAATLLRTGGHEGKPKEKQVLARVNDHTLTVARFNHSYVQALIRTGGNDTPEHRYAHIDRLIQAYLLADEAQRRGLQDRPAYREYMERQHKLALGGRYFDIALADALPPPSEADVRDAFRKTKEQVVLRHLFFRDPSHAEAAYALLEDGMDFVQLANQVFETTAFDSLAGFLGVASYWALDDTVAEAAFSLPVGTYSGPIRSRYGWHILRVEERLINPLLTESEYQYRRDGIAAQTRLRRNRLAGDRFVRTLMESLDVEADRQAALLTTEALRRVLQDEEKEAEGLPRVALRNEEVEALRDVLTPETVLLTYTLDGETHPFTALDFFNWLPEMPYEELRSRPMASVGRALRNDVLAQRGTTQGLDNDPGVEETLQYLSATFLSEQLSADLREQARAEPTEADMREAFEQLGYRQLEEARARYWLIRFSSLRDAEAAKKAIEAGTRAPTQYDTYAPFEDADLKTSELGDEARRALLDTPMLVCTDATACSLMQVTDRTLRYSTFDEQADKIRERLSRMLPEVHLLDSLRQQAVITVDTLLFTRMMVLR